MEKDQIVKIGTEEFIFAIKTLDKAFSNFIDEKIKYYSSVGSVDHVKWLYVVTENYVYLYEASNGLKLNDSIFQIALNQIDCIGLMTVGLTDIVYAVLLDGTIIPLKTYVETEKVKKTVGEINTIIKKQLIASNIKDESFKATIMILRKPIIKKDEYYSDYFSAYDFEELNGRKLEYIKKRSGLINKIKKNKQFGKEKKCDSVSLINVKVDMLIKS